MHPSPTPTAAGSCSYDEFCAQFKRRALQSLPWIHDGKMSTLVVTMPLAETNMRIVRTIGADGHYAQRVELANSEAPVGNAFAAHEKMVGYCETHHVSSDHLAAHDVLKILDSIRKMPCNAAIASASGHRPGGRRDR